MREWGVARLRDRSRKYHEKMERADTRVARGVLQ